MVNKLTNNVKPLDEVDKINEIIDELDNIDPLPSQTGQSGKYLTTNGTVPSWADVQSLPSQTGKAGLYLQTDGTDASWEGVPGRNIGEIVASTIPLTDAGLHLLDGALIQGSGIYSAFVDYIAGLVSTYPNLFVTESAWQTAVTTYGVCGKFVYDSVNNTVRLPKYNSKIYTGGGTAPVVGNGMTLGLTNGNTNYGLSGWAGDTFSQVMPNLYGTTIGSVGSGSSNQSLSLGITTDSTKSGIIADISNITTSLDGYYYIVIATSTKTDIEVDIDEVVTDLNGKADIDLTNTTPAISFATAMDNSGIRTVIETYQNGTSWYRVYSDGWCEQGGVITNATYQGTTVNLLKSYSDTNYTGFVTLRRTSNDGQGDINPQFGIVNTSQVNIGGGAHNGSICQWVSYGYIS